MKSVGIMNNSIFVGLLIRNVHFLIHSLTKKGFLKFSLAIFFESSFQKNASKSRQLASKETLLFTVVNGCCTSLDRISGSVSTKIAV